MNNLKIFENKQLGNIRVIDQNGEPYFVLKDVCEVLGLSDTNKTAERLDDDELTRTKLVSGGQEREMYIINESGLYNVILRSEKPQAKQFKRWITHEVLPKIRKHGAYMTDQALYRAITEPDFLIRLATELRDEKVLRIEMQNKIETDRPKVLFADAVSASHTSILVGELAKLLRQNGIEIGQNRLFQWLRDNGYLIKRKGTDWNMPTQTSMEMGLFEIKESTHIDGNGCNITTKTPKVTGKWQQYFINKLMGGIGA